MLAYHDTQLSAATLADAALVRALQADLRALGYLKRGIDGVFGAGTTLAVRRLQYDLLHNHGRSTGHDGNAPLKMTDFVGGVTEVTGVVDSALASAIEALLNAAAFIKLPTHTDPAAANQAALAAVKAQTGKPAPTPFLLAIFQQESGCEHFSVALSAADQDNYVIVGLDNASTTEDRITSRGYGIGQYTIFHHPPRPDEVNGFILDPVGNVSTAFAELADKFSNFLVGPADTADDRKAEHPLLPLRECKYLASDRRYKRDCQACTIAARKLDIEPDTPLYIGSTQNYGQATAYANPHYQNVPDRADFLCDWPYAVRRYNGSGPNSFNYQAIILKNLLRGV